MGFPKGNLGMIIAAIVGGLSSALVVSIFLLLYFKRKRKLKGYRSLQNSDFLMTQPGGRPSRAKSCFDVLYTVHENGKAPEFSIPVTRPKTRPKRTCQLQFSLLYNFHTLILKIQVMCAVNLPRLFGLQSGMFVKVQLFSSDGEISQNLGKTATQFRSKNPVFKDSFVTTEIPYEQLQEMKLGLSLYSYDRFSQGHFVGSAGLKFKDINLDPLDAVIFWRPVQRKVHAVNIEVYSSLRGLALYSKPRKTGPLLINQSGIFIKDFTDRPIKVHVYSPPRHSANSRK